MTIWCFHFWPPLRLFKSLLFLPGKYSTYLIKVTRPLMIQTLLTFLALYLATVLWHSSHCEPLSVCKTSHSLLPQRVFSHCFLWLELSSFFYGLGQFLLIILHLSQKPEPEITCSRKLSLILHRLGDPAKTLYTYSYSPFGLHCYFLFNHLFSLLNRSSLPQGRDNVYFDCHWIPSFNM